jgi:hypothetical protein
MITGWDFAHPTGRVLGYRRRGCHGRV